MKNLLIVSAFALSALTATDSSATYQTDADGSYVSAHVKGTAGLTIDAKNTHLTVDDSGNTLKFILQSNQFETGIKLRDEHTSKAIESDKYPTITLSLDDDKLHHPASVKLTDQSKGSLTFHGVTKLVTVDYSAQNNCKGKVNVTADFSFDMREFGIKPPSYLGVGVKPNVNIHAVIQLLSDSGC